MQVDVEIQNDILPIAQQFTTDPVRAVTPITDGSINTTYEVTTDSDDRFILQGMSEIFDTVVLDNLLKVEPILSEAGVTIPTCLPTTSGKYYVEQVERWYRALTYIPGTTIHDGATPTCAESAGRLIGRFHDVLAETDITIEDPIAHFHDTEHHMSRLLHIREKFADSEKWEMLNPLVTDIITRYKNVAHDVHELPTRIIHADLKLSNVRFDENNSAVALIDMDTLMPGTILIEMGDALRSWCGTGGEDNHEQVFDRAVYEAALSGYTSTVTNITKQEIESIPKGIELMTLELAARFVMDAYDETYFAQSSKYPSLYEQNKARAENQLRFHEAFVKEELV